MKRIVFAALLIAVALSGCYIMPYGPDGGYYDGGGHRHYHDRGGYYDGR
ncbi:MAG TPA: hypothetical protein VGK71_06995 [Nitrospirota bacterium]|jgi:hypothetical protein